MSKKRKNGPQKPEIEGQADYYKLKTQAVDDLVNASEDNSPPVPEEELRAYRSGPRMKVADWVKMLFIKFWFAGAVCFFFLWGLGGYWCPEKFRPENRRQAGLFLLVWTLLPAALCVWANQGGLEVLRIALFPQLMARLAWFYSLYDGPQSAHVLDTLRPLAAAGTHVLMMAGFAAGLWIRGKTQQKK